MKRMKISDSTFFSIAAAVVLAFSPASAQAQCTQGASVEANINSRWWPGTVVGPSTVLGSCAVSHRANFDVEMVTDIPTDRIRHRGANTPAEGTPAIPAGQAVVRTTPQQVYERFRRDTEGAVATFVGKTVQVRGIVHSADVPNALFKDEGDYETIVSCNFAPENRAHMRSIRAGGTYLLEGSDAVQSGPHSLHLKNCRILGGSAPTPPARQLAVSTHPPMGRYTCQQYSASSGYQPQGTLTLNANGTYTVGGVTGRYSYDRATKRFTWSSGSYQKWGWSGDYLITPQLGNRPAQSEVRLQSSQGLDIRCSPIH